jgi:hypothetical protein
MGLILAATRSAVVRSLNSKLPRNGSSRTYLRIAEVIDHELFKETVQEFLLGDAGQFSLLGKALPAVSFEGGSRLHFKIRGRT